MIEWLKYHARIELEQIRQPDAPYAYVAIMLAVAFIIGCTLLMRLRAGDMMVTP